MTYSRAVVERAGELRRSGLSCREIARELDGPSKSAVARWTRAGAAGGTVGRAVAKMDLPKVVGDGPVYPDIDPDDKDALIERLVLENAVLRAVNDVLKDREPRRDVEQGEDPGDRPPEAVREVVLERTHEFLGDIKELL